MATAGVAHAQVHWDASAQAGVLQRVPGGRPAGVPLPDVGPFAQLEAHVAVVPMVRAGVYAAGDVAREANAARGFWAAGLHARVSPPLLPAPWRAWLSAGAGIAVERSTYGGTLIDLPLGLGLGRRVGRTLLPFAELGVRFGLLPQGPLFDASAARALYAGKDAFSLTASVGLSFEP